MPRTFIKFSYEEPSSAEFVKEEQNFNESEEIEQDSSEKSHVDEIGSFATNKKTPLSGFFVHIKVETGENGTKLLRRILPEEKDVSTSDNNSIEQLGMIKEQAYEHDVDVKVKTEDQPTIEVDSQEPHSKTKNSTTSPKGKTTTSMPSEGRRKRHTNDPAQLRRSGRGLQNNMRVEEQPKVKIHSHQSILQAKSSLSSSEGNSTPVPSCGGEISGLTSSQRKTWNNDTVKTPPMDSLKKNDRGVRNDKTVQTPRPIVRSSMDPYVRLERLENLFIHRQVVRSVNPKTKASVSSTRLNSTKSSGKGAEGQSGTIVRRNRRGYIKTPEGKLKCEVCEREFKHSSILTNHLRIHTGEKPFKCEVCRKPFSQIGNLRKHMTRHTGETPYECDVCKRAFAQYCHLSRHMKTHTGETPFKCKICSKEFAENGTLNTHMRVHTRETPYKCHVCKRSFSHSGTLITHLRTHSGETPFKCKHCPSAFKHKGSLNSHNRIHTGETPYHCPICNRAFSQLSHLTNHKRAHTGETPYRCDYCPKAYTRHNILIAHLWKTHW